MFSLPRSNLEGADSYPPFCGAAPAPFAPLPNSSRATLSRRSLVHADRLRLALSAAALSNSASPGRIRKRTAADRSWSSGFGGLVMPNSVGQDGPPVKANALTACLLPMSRRLTCSLIWPTITFGLRKEDTLNSSDPGQSY